MLSKSALNTRNNAMTVLMTEPTNIFETKKRSIIDSMSPAELVKFSMVSKEGGGIEGYRLPEQHKRAESYSVFKSKEPGPIQKEAVYRMQFPGAGHYNTFESSWDVQMKLQ